MDYDASGSKARKGSEMPSSFSHIAALVAGLAIIATAFTAMPRSLLKGTAAAIAFGVVAALPITAVRAYGAEETPQKTSVEQADKSQEQCLARRQREGLNIRFAAHRCINPND